MFVVLLTRTNVLVIRMVIKLSEFIMWPRRPRKKIFPGKVWMTIMVLAGTAIVFLGRTHAYGSLPLRTVIARPGDTVWSIAREEAGDRHDVRDVVYEIEVINHLNGARIDPGMKLLVPAE
jgi:hypothetical protein